MFSGDTILEVNGERVQYALVEKVVEAITRVPYHPQYGMYIHQTLYVHQQSYLPIHNIHAVEVCVTTILGNEKLTYHDINTTITLWQNNVQKD